MNSLLIVCHPDDEILWAYSLLKNKKDVDVVCLTNADHSVRSQAFRKVSQKLGFNGEIYSWDDRTSAKFDENDLFEIETFLRKRIPKYKSIYTHGPYGEYNHASHIQISNMISNLVNDKQSLYYFKFKRPQSHVIINSVRLESILSYFPRTNLKKLRSYAPWLSYKNISPRLKLRYLIDSFVELILEKINAKFNSMKSSDYGHIAASTGFFSIISSQYNDTMNEDTSICYDYNFNPKSATDVFLRNKEIYDKFKDRKFLVSEFLPKCTGLTLSVGCHYYNKLDAYCLPSPENYRTIDINPKNSIYGSPFGHQTGDFLLISEENKYSNIILFGVLGIPPATESQNGDFYSMYDHPVDALKKADSLLVPTGQLLIAPDLNIDSNLDYRKKVVFWEDIISELLINSMNYTLNTYIRTNYNSVFVLSKL